LEDFLDVDQLRALLSGLGSDHAIQAAVELVELHHQLTLELGRLVDVPPLHWQWLAASECLRVLGLHCFDHHVL